jgi:hypothetical protein
MSAYAWLIVYLLGIIETDSSIIDNILSKMIWVWKGFQHSFLKKFHTFLLKSDLIPNIIEVARF